MCLVVIREPTARVRVSGVPQEHEEPPIAEALALIRKARNCVRTAVSDARFDWYRLILRSALTMRQARHADRPIQAHHGLQMRDALTLGGWPYHLFCNKLAKYCCVQHLFGQVSQGSFCNAVAATAGAPARLVARADLLTPHIRILKIEWDRAQCRSK